MLPVAVAVVLDLQVVQDKDQLVRVALDRDQLLLHMLVLVEVDMELLLQPNLLRQ
jgi:hypothetical protein|tara:strand:+ start:275 stop:439 length:165 start_codon:yes stop_codon:yes gene_type:complete